MRFGIDISDAQGVFDWDKAEGVTFAVLKGGGGNNGFYTNKQFQRNYEECVKRGIDVGCYWFSKALTVEQAEQEAAYFFDSCLTGKKFTLPVYMDVEHKDMLALGKDALTSIVLAFCEALGWASTPPVPCSRAICTTSSCSSMPTGWPSGAKRAGMAGTSGCGSLAARSTSYGAPRLPVWCVTRITC